MENLIAQLEALLFIYGEPMATKKIVKILNHRKTDDRETVNAEAVKAALTALKEKLKDAGRGLELILSEDQVQLVTKPEWSAVLGEVVKEELNETLTPAALETLAIIAYSGPVGRSIVDYIRGVNSTFILRSLVLRGLVDRAPDPERPNAYIYRPSFDLLKYLGISKTDDLPDYQKFRELVEKLRTGAEPNS